MIWLARNSGPSQARNALVLGHFLFFVLDAIEDVRANLAGTLPPTKRWISVVLWLNLFKLMSKA